MTPTIYELRCRDRIECGPDVLVLGFDPPLQSPELQPGHFFMLAVPGDERCFRLRRPFSIFSWWENGWEFLIQITGWGTRRLAGLGVGETLSMVGPLGRPFPLAQSGQRVLLLSGGIGMATLYPLHVTLAQRGVGVFHVYGARTADRLVELSRLIELPGEVDVATDDGSTGFHGRLDAWVMANAERIRHFDCVYMCGPIAMMTACYRALRRFMEGPIHASMEVIMGCGYGVCRGCAVPVREGLRYRMACVDGPVFSCDEVNWSWWTLT